jgi:hypothetical protein
LGDFLAHGAPKGIVPTPLFDPAWYLRSYPDVRRSGLDPFLHYVASGDRDGRSPGAWFDATWYRMRNPDVRDGNWTPFIHYLARGAANEYDPSPGFSAPWYLSKHGNGFKPSEALQYYVRKGRLSWHSTHPLLPPPDSPVALWEELPWSPQPRQHAGTPMLLMAHDKAGMAKATEFVKAVIRAPASKPFLLTRVPPTKMPEGIPVLELPEPLPAPWDTIVSRVLRALKAYDGAAIVVQIGQDAAASSVIKELELAEAEIWPKAKQQNPAVIQQDFVTSPTVAKSERSITVPLAISAIVPNYNHARYLDERIESVLSQHYPVSELIVLDDCSTDDSLAVLEKWQRISNVPFKIVRNRVNSGSAFGQWHSGVHVARGDLVWIAESDDSSSASFLERLIPRFADNRLVLAYCESRAIGEEGEWLADSYRFYTDSISERKWLSGYIEEGHTEIDQALAIKNTIPNVSAALWRRSALVPHVQTVSSFRYCGDWRAYISCLGDGRIAYHPEALNAHRQRRTSVTKQGETGTPMLEEALRIKSALWRSPAVSDRSRVLGLMQIIVEAIIRIGPNAPAFVDTLKDQWFSAVEVPNVIETCLGKWPECRAFANRLISEEARFGLRDREENLRTFWQLLSHLSANQPSHTL